MENNICINFFHIDDFQKEIKIIKHNNISITENNLKKTEIYNNIDVLIIPSLWNETGPKVLYEAFANRIPVIISDQPSLVEKVHDRQDSYVFKT